MGKSKICGTFCTPEVLNHADGAAMARLLAPCCYLLWRFSACSSASVQVSRVGLITPGSIADAAWNAAAYQGLQRIHDSLQLPSARSKPGPRPIRTRRLRAYAAQGYDLVFANGFEFQDPAERVSAQYPENRVHRDIRAAGPVERRAPHFPAGGGELSRRNDRGRAHQDKYPRLHRRDRAPPIKAAYQGWVNGARAVNPKIRSREIYLNSFDDPAAGREAALALMRAGADMFHHNADAAALGLFQASKEQTGVYVFGANADQSGSGS